MSSPSKATRTLRLALANLLAVRAIAATAADAPAPASAPKPERVFSSSLGKITGDFDRMLEHRSVRMLVPYSRTLFFHDRGRAHGTTAEAAAELEKHLNAKYPGKTPITVALIPTPRDQLLPKLVAGEGDIAAGDLTITDARLQQVDFTTPTFRDVAEIVITGPGAPELRSLDDLAGQRVYVRPSSSYHESLVALNQRFQQPSPPLLPLPPIVLVPLPEEIEDEDVLDMVQAGLIPIAVVDDWLVRFWAEFMPDLKPHPELAVRRGGQIAWAIRKQSPQLQAELDAFIVAGLKRGLDRVLLRNATAAARRMHNATSAEEMKKFAATVDLFRRYAAEYRFDYLLLVAQGYQESRLDQNAKSHVGAIGIMQVMPATGAELNVGDIRQTEANVHAGSKYMATLMDRYFKDAKFDEQNRTLFAFASYNAGPGNIAKVRKRAAQEGLNPDIWLHNVENVAARVVSQEPVRYVRNIYKYYVAYSLAQQAEAERAQAVERLKGATPE